MMLSSFNVKSQELFQQTTMELNEELDEDQTYLCQATSSIELLPGFGYSPSYGNNMLLDIDRYSVFPPVDGTYVKSLDGEDYVVGSIPASFGVSNTGAASYSVDIQLPQALGGMAPKLSLAYNSQGVDGLLGWSWELMGISSIERTGQTEYHDGKTTGVDFKNDRYVLDGQRLMLVGDNTYKTEIDNFDKVVSYSETANGPEYFVVWKNDGTICEYGVTEDSKIEIQGNRYVALKWLISSAVDRNGNTITYHYHENNAKGESYIKEIEYASNEKLGVFSAYKVVFQYDDKLDLQEGYVYGNKVTKSKILKTIEVFNNYSGEKIIEYALRYDVPGYYDGSYYMHYRLNSIQLTIDGKKVAPTRIAWNSKDKWSTENSCGYKKYELDKTKFNKVSLVGDFNGDGLSDVLMLPYKMHAVYASDVYGEVYLNNGDGTFEQNPSTRVLLNKNLDWIYVVDINGDGLDDIIPYEIHYDDLGAFSQSKYSLMVMNDGVFLNKGYRVFDKPLVIIPGNYIDKYSSGILVLDAYDGKKNNKNAHYIMYQNGLYFYKEIENSNVINGKNVNAVAMDMSGDGISDLLSLEDDGYRVYGLKLTDGNLCLELLCGGGTLTNEIYPFPNDYNGDGKVDLLYYDPAHFWNVAFSKGSNFAKAESCLNNNLLRNVRLNSKDRYCYSLKEMQKPTVAIRTADFDGDGTADVGVFNNRGGNYYLEIGFSLQKSNLPCGDFLYQRRYYMPINYSHQTIQLGRFLPQENVSILSGLPKNPSSAAKAYITTITPNSAYYSVEQITDGMGNSTELTYDYLFPEKNNKTSFYTYEKSNRYGAESKPVPMLALSEVRTYNVNDKPVVKKYSYRNAYIHKKGHGFLGFESVVTRDYIAGNLVRKQIQDYKLEPMESSAILLLCGDRIYCNESHLISEKSYAYTKYVCTANNKVVLPLVLNEWEGVFDTDKKNVLIKNTYTANMYVSDIASDKLYKEMVCLSSAKKGYDDIKSMNIDGSQYVEEVQITYDNDVKNWLVNRPKKIVESVCDKTGNMIGNVKLIEYDETNSMKVSKEIMIPNVLGDMDDSLLLVVDYKYDKFGNVIEQKLSSPSLKADKVTKAEYGDKYQYRYKTKSIDEMGRETLCEYDDDFGLLKSTIDFNNLATNIENEPFGIKSVVVLPDGMKNVKVIRWSEDNRYAPKNASYYVWEKSVGKSECLVFYHKSGVELRRVAFDLNGDAVFVDKIYDDFGNVKQESYPYYKNDDILYVSNVYDVHNRKVESVYPNETAVVYMYDGNDVEMEYHCANEVKNHRKERYNMMGWLTSVVDAGGNEVNYEYYSDGSLKSTQIGEARNTRIEITYDNRRNKTSICDPNYGLVSYKYDALGNIVEMRNLQEVITYEYDVLGRIVSENEYDVVQKTKNIVRWEYGRESGKDGVLSKISTSKNHQIEYEYDDKLRVVDESELINGVWYRTSYSYDEANRLSLEKYPSGFSVLRKYSNSGYERMVCDATTKSVLWRTNKTNAIGSVTEYQVGNGLKTQYLYNPKNFMIERIVTTKGDEILQNVEYEYDAMCNLTSRCDLKNHNREEFEYDVYDRLTKIILNGNVSGVMKYYSSGNIAEKTVNGVKVMYNTAYAGTKPNAIVRVHSDDDKMYDRFNQKVRYSLYDNVVAIEDDAKSIIMDYGCDNKRIYMRYNVGNKVKEKTYVGDCEYVVEDGKRDVVTYLKGPMGVFAIHIDGEDAINYVHKDNLESWNIVTDKNGRLLEELSFDAWGNMRNPIRWDEKIENEDLLYDRGFTGHEHLLDFGLINMNGRLYDPVMSMMLSPDNNIQLPKSSQNFNRYSYCLNNPLKYTDPTGEWVESVVFGVVGGATNLLFNAKNIDSFGEAALLFGAGFVKGFLTEYTMGQSWLLQVGVGAVGEGLVAGANQMVSVGDGSLAFAGDEWNSVKTASFYGLGSGLVKSFMHTYWAEPTEEQYGESFFEMCEYREYAHGMTSLMAHGVGCWFSGQSFLSTMRFKDVGFDLKMLGIVAKRLISSYIHTKTDFGEKAVKQRAEEIKSALLQDMLSENPDTPDFNYEYSLSGVFLEDFRLYVVGNIFEILPSEYEIYVPKPYFEEVMTFPFSFSLFKTLFFKED